MKIKQFSLGKLYGTPGALKELSPERITEILSCFSAGDWGCSGRDDGHLNDVATHEGTRIFAAYWIDEKDHDRGKVWCICENDRSHTTLLLPNEY